MTGRLAALVLLGICLLLAGLVVAGAIGRVAAGVAFAIALATMGALSGGFRAR
jgi:hypothetical protein